MAPNGVTFMRNEVGRSAQHGRMVRQGMEVEMHATKYESGSYTPVLGTACSLSRRSIRTGARQTWEGRIRGMHVLDRTSSKKGPAMTRAETMPRQQGLNVATRNFNLPLMNTI